MGDGKAKLFRSLGQTSFEKRKKNRTTVGVCTKLDSFTCHFFLCVSQWQARGSDVYRATPLSSDKPVAELVSSLSEGDEVGFNLFFTLPDE